MKKYVFPLMLVLATFVMAPGWAQAGSGFYISSDIGLNCRLGDRYYRTQQRSRQRVRSVH